MVGLGEEATTRSFHLGRQVGYNALNAASFAAHLDSPLVNSLSIGAEGGADLVARAESVFESSCLSHSSSTGWRILLDRADDERRERSALNLERERMSTPMPVTVMSLVSLKKLSRVAKEESDRQRRSVRWSGGRERISSSRVSERPLVPLQHDKRPEGKRETMSCRRACERVPRPRVRPLAGHHHQKGSLFFHPPSSPRRLFSVKLSNR